MSNHTLISKEELEDLYLNKHWNYQEIGKFYGKTRQRICQLIKVYNIDTSTGTRFLTQCPYCDKPFESFRKHFRSVALRYCSQSCYQAHRASISEYRPHRQGQRLARSLMAKQVARELTSKEVVHHIDGNCDNNDIDNLILFASHSEHLRYHHQTRMADKTKK